MVWRSTCVAQVTSSNPVDEPFSGALLLVILARRSTYMSGENGSCFAQLRPYQHCSDYTPRDDTSRRGRRFSLLSCVELLLSKRHLKPIS